MSLGQPRALKFQTVLSYPDSAVLHFCKSRAQAKHLGFLGLKQTLDTAAQKEHTRMSETTAARSEAAGRTLLDVAEGPENLELALTDSSRLVWSPTSAYHPRSAAFRGPAVQMQGSNVATAKGNLSTWKNKQKILRRCLPAARKAKKRMRQESEGALSTKA